MLIEFATKRSTNGNRKYLGIDTDAKTFSRDKGRWYCREDIVEIGARDRHKLIAQLKKEGYEERPFFLL